MAALNDNHEKTALLKNSFAIGIGTLSSKALSFLLVPLYSIWLSPSDYGTYDLVASYVALCVPFATLQLEQALYRNCVSDPENSKRYFSTVISLVAPLLCVVALVVLFLTLFVFHLNVGIEFTLYFVALAFFNLLTEYIRGEKQLVAYSVANLCSGLLILLFSVLFVGFLKLGLHGVLYVYPCSYGIVSVVLVVIYRPANFAQIDFSLLKSMLKFSIPLIPNNIAWWFSNVSNRTIINMTIGSFYNGLFAVSSKIPTILSLMFSVFNLAFQQTAIQSIDSPNSKKFFSKLFDQLVSLLVSSCILIIVLVPLAYSIFIDKEYWDGIYCIPLLLAGAFMLSLAQFLGDIMMAQRRTSKIGTSTVVAAVINVFITFSLIYYMGLMAAALASFIGYVFMFSLRLFELREIFSIKHVLLKIVSWLLGFFVISSTAYFLFDRTMLYYLIVLAVFPMFFVANRSLFSFLARKLKR